MLVRLNITQWTARKTDKAVTHEVARAKGAAEELVKVNKLLMDKAALAGIVSAVGSARTFHYANTLPWSDDGARILPAANFMAYTAGLRKLESEFRAAADTFLEQYVNHRTAAQRLLNGLFSAADYPEPAEVARRFSWSVSVDPLPAADDFRVNLGADDVDAIKAALQNRLAESIKGATADLWRRLAEAVGHCAGKLAEVDAGGKAGIFRDTLIGNLRELVAILPRLNLADDAALEAMRAEVESKLAGLNPQELRDNSRARADAAAEAKVIADKMAAYMEVM